MIFPLKPQVRRENAASSGAQGTREGGFFEGTDFAKTLDESFDGF